MSDIDGIFQIEPQSWTPVDMHALHYAIKIKSTHEIYTYTT